jgi:DNA (cytosine-5)-methyltransferase 1
MADTYRVVDVFAGPGGLAEGFSRWTDPDGSRPFRLALSVEKEAPAHRTLRMRSFFRQFPDGAPDAYYDFLAGRIDEAALVDQFPTEWTEADREALKLELGRPEHDRELAARLDELAGSGAETVLIGGPPCQAYSLVGRARNMGISGYTASGDKRHYLYREYIRIIDRLKPAAFVMENVKGLLSSKVENELIFHKVIEDLEAAGSGYVLVPLAAPSDSEDFVVRAEDFGIPQRRHRVIIVGVRSDLAPAGGMPWGDDVPLVRHGHVLKVRDAIGDLPALRSGLSKAPDGPAQWKSIQLDAFQQAAEASLGSGTPWAYKVGQALARHRGEAAQQGELPRSSSRVSATPDPWLAEWLDDDRLTGLPNHETRGHMAADLARYVFASTFTELLEKSPKAADYPAELVPEHRNWTTGKFADRFRAQGWKAPSTTVTSHISKDGHYFIHPDPLQARSLTVREAARLQTFPDNYIFLGNRTEQFVQVGNAVPPLLAMQIAGALRQLLRVGNMAPANGAERARSL